MSSKILFSFKENYADVAVVSKGINKIKIKKVARIEERSEIISGGQPYADEYNLNKIKSVREKFKVRNRNIGIILNWDNIVTRIIDVPIMNKKDLRNFIENNIEEYFTVSMNEYSYDYEIISLDKEYKKGKMAVMLAVVPRIKLKKILEFIKCCGLIPMSIGIYPDYISNLFLDQNDNSIAVIDANSGKTTLTILDKEKIFLYSHISSENYQKDEKDFSDILENLEYFLNFYSTRHFGNKIEKIYILGEFYNSPDLYELISSQTSMEPIMGLDTKMSKLIKNSPVDGNIYADVLGYFIPVKNIYNKNIDFVDRLYRKDKKKASANKLIAVEIIICMFITLIIAGGVFIYSKVNLSRYDTSGIDSQIAALSNVQNDIDRLEREKKEYEEKINNMQKINNDEFDYIGVLDTLRQGLPEEVSVKSITIDKNNVNVTFNINNSTIDGARVVVALNKMNIFEPVELSQIELNDDVKEITLNLKIIDSYKGVSISGKK
ncbi:pilus assembly protein PilM [Clostridium sp. WILCCON 0269]|uniref:Pilus assembly protein PilM n=1 Tax=Candidatus Clostridium eludens TaxID=3381663 RepID=A0ABW8SHS6_9CLOT